MELETTPSVRFRTVDTINVRRPGHSLTLPCIYMCRTICQERLKPLLTYQRLLPSLFALPTIFPGTRECFGASSGSSCKIKSSRCESTRRFRIHSVARWFCTVHIFVWIGWSSCKIMKHFRLNICLLNKRGVGKRSELYNIVDSSQQVVLTIQKQENSFFLFSCCIKHWQRLQFNESLSLLNIGPLLFSKFLIVKLLKSKIVSRLIQRTGSKILNV